MELLFIWVAIAAVTAYGASQKNRNALSWFFIGLLFGIFGLIAMAFAKTLPAE